MEENKLNNNQLEENLNSENSHFSVEIEKIALLNKQKFMLFKFMTYNAKYEISYEAFIGNLYWISFLEISIWIILCALFISSPSNLEMMWCYIFHLPRSIIGFVILKYLPNSYNAIEKLKDFENSSLEDIKNQMIDNYKQVLSESDPKLKPLLIFYFLLTIFNLMIDIGLVIVLLNLWGLVDYKFNNIIMLSADLVFLSNITLIQFAI